MQVIELSKSYCNEFYNGNFNEMIEKKDGNIFDDEKIKKAFNFNNGTKKDFKSYMENNKQYCKYYDLVNRQYI